MIALSMIRSPLTLTRWYSSYVLCEFSKGFQGAQKVVTTSGSPHDSLQISTVYEFVHRADTHLKQRTEGIAWFFSRRIPFYVV